MANGFYPIVCNGVNSTLVCGYPVFPDDLKTRKFGGWYFVRREEGEIIHYPVLCKLTDIWAD